MKHEELDKLRELASKATPGPWVWGKAWGKTYGEIDGLHGKENNYVLYMHTYEYEAGGHIEIGKDNAAFIAAVNPSTLTALLDHIDRLEREAKAGRELRDSTYGTMIIYHEFLPEHLRSEMYSTIKAYDTATKETGQ